MEIFIFIAAIIILILLWLNIIATIAIKYDQTLDYFQKKAQTTIVWLIPVIGSSFILKMVIQHSPEAIPKKLIPWPFKKALYGKQLKPNTNRDENELDYCRSNYINKNPNFESSDVDNDSGGE